MAKLTRSRPTARARGRAGVEWVGGCFLMPYVREDEPHRPELAVWLELPSGLVVGHCVIAQNGESALAKALKDALDRPITGTGGSPPRLRVADAGLAADVRSHFGERFSIDVAPTPELDELYEHFLQAMPTAEDDASYLEGGRVPEGAMTQMFAAAAVLYRCGPWRLASDDEVLRADIPALDVKGACISIMGALGESLGLVVFPSLLAFERFRSAAEQAARGHRTPDLGGPILSLEFWRARDLPAGMRREVASHGWPTVSPDAFPVVAHRDRDGMPRPVTERDVQIATECAFAIASFFVRHPDAFGGRLREPISESMTAGKGRAIVRLMAPYDAYTLFEPTPRLPRGAVAPSRAPRRRSPPPTPARSAETTRVLAAAGRSTRSAASAWDGSARQRERQRAGVHELEERIVRHLGEFAADRYGPGWEAAKERFAKAADATDPLLVALSVPWSVYEACIDGERPVDAFLEEQGSRLSAEERAWLVAQHRASVSVWEVLSCDPGVQVTVQDLFSGERRSVREVRGSRDLVARDAVLARVVDYEGASYFCGMYPRLLPPDGAADVIAAVRKRAGSTAPKVLDDKRGLALVRAWAKVLRERDQAASSPKKLVNTDGEAFISTVDHFEFGAEARAEIHERISRVEGVERESESDEGARFTIFKKGNAVHAHWDNTVLAHVVIEKGRLRLETNSVERGDRLRAQLEAACGGLLRHRGRAHADPLSTARPAPERGAPRPPVPPEALEAVRELKVRHFAAWIDASIPALDDTTPRQAARTKRGRERVDVLLRTMENAEHRAGDGAPFDFGPLRRSLGIHTESFPSGNDEDRA
jgi:hypothetical protein